MVDSFAADAFPRWNFQFYCPSALKQLTIIGRRWAKYRDLSVASRSISWRQITDLRDTDKSRHFAITVCSIIVLSFDHRVCFFNENPREAKRSAIFTQERSQEGEKQGFLYACAEYYLQPNTSKHSCTALRISRPLFVGSYLQVTWWAFLQFWVLLGGDSAEERAVHERYMMLAYVQWRQKTSYKYGNGQLLFKNQSYF